MAKAKKWIVWVLIIAAVIGGIVFYVRSRAPKTLYTTADAIRGTLNQTVSVTGDLVANEEITLNFELGGRVSKVFVKPSDQVAAGDRIATLTDDVLQKQVDQAKANLDQAIASAGTNSDELREARVTVDNARNTLDQTKDLNDRNIKAAKSAVEDAENYYDDAKKLYDSSQTPTNKLTRTSAENALNSAEQSLKVAQEQADLAKANAENTLNSAEARVKTVESDFAQDSRDASVAEARANYEMSVLNFNKATLVSPVNGIITEVNNKEGEVLGTGVIKETFSRVMSLDMIIESQVPESDIVKIRNGEHAKITFDALSQDDVFDGEIIELDPASTTIQDVVYYQIKLRMNTADSRIKPGMSANVDIATAEKKDVIMVPMRAVKTDDASKKKYVDVLQTDNTTKKAYVETGLQGDEGMVEIKSGLSGGEKVVTFVATK
ncbi:MAG: efflux RND transporter periplasmic adaptor subunit [Candidatus Moranbacteria bacterium]|nr:efflux RND transporter periplasmic adaptor subunit [Candidatus Moranbacteria bacterium]